MRPPLLVVGLLALGVGGAGCAVSGAVDRQPAVGPVTPTGPPVTVSAAASTTSSASDATHQAQVASSGPVETRPPVTDDRVYVLGDSIAESISSRYSGAICDMLGPLGWQVTVDAAQSRTTGQAVQSLRANRTKVGQVVVILIGHNDTDPDSYLASMQSLLALVPGAQWILLLTNYEFERGRDRMNDVLRLLAAGDSRIELVEWNDVVDHLDGAVQRDGLHLTSIGQEALVATIATALGAAPRPAAGITAKPVCTTLRSPRPPTTSGGSGTGGGGTPRTTTTPAPPPAPTSPTTGGGGGGGGGTTTQAPATDAPPATDGPSPATQPKPPSGQGSSPPPSEGGGSSPTSEP